MRHTRKNQAKSRPVFAVVVDGECEVWYLQMFKRNERSININIEPKIPQKKSIQEQYKMVCHLAKEYTKVFWIIDFDCILSETKECKKSKQKPLDLFNQFYKELENNKKVVIIINNPCLEFWFLLHFEQTSKYFECCDTLLKYLKKKPILKDYNKSQYYYTKENNDIYLKLKPFITDAIKHAKMMDAFTADNPHRGMAEMHKFFEDDEFKQALNLAAKSRCTQ